MRSTTARFSLLMLVLSLTACAAFGIGAPGADTTPTRPPVVINEDRTPIPTATMPVTPTPPTSTPIPPTEVRTPEPIPGTASAGQACSPRWFFTPQPDGCPGDAWIESFATAEFFEQGMMIYVQELEQIYVFVGDLNEGGVFYVFHDPFVPGTPRSDPEIVPPAGRYQPELGFGAVWRGAYDDQLPTPMREALGWALGAEFAYNTRYQCGDPVSVCYLRDPGGDVIVMTGDQAVYWPPRP